MNWYPWLTAPYRQLVAQHQSGRGHHALLVHAIAGCGDDSLMYALGRWLMCQRPNGDKSCGECHSCRLMLAGNHPDWYDLQPEKGKTSLGIEPVRQIIEHLYGHAQQGGAKVVLLPRAEALTEAAANALLKTLEEPPEKTYFLLGTREPANLLATLRSRCFYMHLAVPDESLSLRWLQSQQPGDELAMRTALRLNGGAPVAAMSLLEPNSWKQRLQLCQGLQQVIPLRQWMQLLPLLNHDNVHDRLTWLCALLLDAMKLQQGAMTAIANLDQQPLVYQLASTQATTILQQQLEQWIFCRHQLLTTTGLNRELMLTRQLCLWSDSFPPSA
ncbi:DNA polymerase III subunit delta' [Obesumbacterium proteus]|uniref:DNA polymerase III subunit delta' n=1 Tax=Obesumbacterium proteus TaxID=82983 RepID=UPI001F3BDA61|nr:DNA polymerase III subunit delta' [Obesumbacterium proteus]MCE9885773.1 DNA polymerase III subunit delta' [Obesumbacterium proteus]MCE9916348.1 DNA polymerase III subunit delta' [Obesumbacterium proteus]MCE9929442.1 DNA polymerase III subunit delta' [Obesumbacterium proteus]MCG2875112.1 DNA polymerase III subunit delta' [Obesumbacterium proteus]